MYMTVYLLNNRVDTLFSFADGWMILKSKTEAAGLLKIRQVKHGVRKDMEEALMERPESMIISLPMERLTRGR
jgi:hypothetical protein